MKIALAQLNYTIGDIDGNTSKIIDSINKAKAQRADLVIFAEQAVSGTPAFDLLRKTTFLELCEDALVEIASCCDGIAAIVGLPILTREGTISAAALIQDRKVLRYVAFGVAAPRPIRCAKAESLMLGRRPTGALLKELRRVVLLECAPRESWRASLELRTQLIQELAERASRCAIEHAGGNLDD